MHWDGWQRRPASVFGSVVGVLGGISIGRDQFLSRFFYLYDWLIYILLLGGVVVGLVCVV